MSTTTKQLPISKINLVGALVGYLVGDWMGALLVFVIPYKTLFSWLNRPITPREATLLPVSPSSYVMPEAAELAHLNPLLTALDNFFNQCKNDCQSCPTNIPGQPCALVMNVYPAMPAEGVKAFFNKIYSYLGAVYEQLAINNELRTLAVLKDQPLPRILYIGTGAAILWAVQFILTYLAGVI